MKYKHKSSVVDAVQWMKPGDHPAVNKYYKVSLSDAPCDWVMIHPGNYILTHSDGSLSVMSEAEFLSKYEPYVIKGGALIPGQCSNCNGGGKVYRHFHKGTWLSSSACSTCHGTGKVEE